MILFLSILSVTQSIISSTKLTLETSQYSNFVWFGFQEGGELNIYVTLEEESKNAKVSIYLKLYLCTPEEFNNLGDLDYHCTEVHSKHSDYTKVSFEKTIKLYITYEIILLNTWSEEIDLKLKYELTNPGGEQLSSGLLEMKYIMLVFAIAWGLLLLLWIAKWTFTKRKRPTLVQSFIVLNCLIWCTFSLIFNYYLHDFSQKGTSNENWFLASRIAWFFSLSVLFALLEFISSGIGITIDCWPKASKARMGIELGLFAVWCLLSELCYGLYVHYLLSGIFAVFLVIYFRSILNNIKLLDIQMEKMMDEGQDVIESLHWNQLRMFRIHLISYLVFLAALGCVSGLYKYYRYIPWVGMGTMIYIIFIWVLLLSIYFRFV